VLGGHLEAVDLAGPVVDRLRDLEIEQRVGGVGGDVDGRQDLSTKAWLRSPPGPRLAWNWALAAATEPVC
jgi:hypothetical protein